MTTDDGPGRQREPDASVPPTSLQMHEAKARREAGPSRASTADFKATPPDTFGGELKSARKFIHESFAQRPLVGLVAAIHWVLDALTPSTLIYYITPRLRLTGSQRGQLVGHDIYNVTVSLLAIVVLATDYRGTPLLVGVLALIRLEEIAVFLFGMLVRLWWAKANVYRVLVYAFQMPFILGIAMRSFATCGFVNSQGACPNGSVGFLYVAFTNMTTLGNQYVPTGRPAQLLTMLAALLGLLLFGGVLSSAIPPSSTQQRREEEKNRDD
jgi:hypothetical protein